MIFAQVRSVIFSSLQDAILTIYECVLHNVAAAPLPLPTLPTQNQSGESRGVHTPVLILAVAHLLAAS